MGGDVRGRLSKREEGDQSECLVNEGREGLLKGGMEDREA